MRKRGETHLHISCIVLRYTEKAKVQGTAAQKRYFSADKLSTGEKPGLFVRLPNDRDVYSKNEPCPYGKLYLYVHITYIYIYFIPFLLQYFFYF